MRPDERELDDEIRGHLALSVQERIDCGEDPEAARLAALGSSATSRATRDSMRRVWYSRWFDAAAALLQDMRIGLRSLRRAKGWRPPSSSRSRSASAPTRRSSASSAACCCGRSSIAAKIASIYIRQSAPGLGSTNTTSRSRRSTTSSHATTTHRARSASSRRLTSRWSASASRGSSRRAWSAARIFEVMGLRPALGRLLDAGRRRARTRRARRC